MTATPAPPLVRIAQDIVCVTDYEAYARERMTPQAWAYMSGGAADERTLHDNQRAFSGLQMLPSILTALKGATTRLELFGCVFDHPIMLAPVAFQRLAHADGEHATVLGASAVNAGMVLSTQASVTLEEIANHAHCPLWFQLYIQPDRAFTEQLIRRAENAGYRALVVTVDAPVSGIRNHEQRTGFSLPAGIEAVNLHGMVHATSASQPESGNGPLFGSGLLQTAPTWRDLEWIVRSTSLPVIVKGVLNPNDVQHALNAGVAGIIVSNHGGRTLDDLPATIDALRYIVKAVKRQVPILLDGGIRRGTDVFKSLALGATAVLIGRPYINGLATAGAAGVAHVVQLLRAELEVAMALNGCPTLASITSSAIWPPQER